jgi:hypothetical protein
VPDENIEYLDSILDNDSDVLDYHKIDWLTQSPMLLMEITSSVGCVVKQN